MIKVLGFKRLVVLGCLILFNLGVGALVYMYLIPEKAKDERALRTVRGQVATLQTDIGRMQIEFDQLNEQQDRFDKLKADGFFSVQGRREAEKVFETIQREAGVVSAVASIKKGELKVHPDAAKAEHTILESPISITIEAFEDTDVFHYLYLLQNIFPGHVSVENLKLQRQAEVTGAVLRRIASGINPDPGLVRADIKAIWRTMIPKSEVISAEGSGP